MTHRASFPIPGENNEFWIEADTADGVGFIYDTRTGYRASTLTREAINKFTLHTAEGYHAECVICQSQPTRADIMDEIEAARILAEIAIADANGITPLNYTALCAGIPEQTEAEQAMREEAAIDQWADARREYKFGKSL